MCMTTPAASALADIRARLSGAIRADLVRQPVGDALVADLDAILLDVRSGVMDGATAAGIAVRLDAALSAFGRYPRDPRRVR